MCPEKIWGKSALCGPWCTFLANGRFEPKADASLFVVFSTEAQFSATTSAKQPYPMLELGQHGPRLLCTVP